MYRLYIDEVGTDGLTNLDKDSHRFLSLTGIAVKLDHVRVHLEPNMNWIKTNVFDHDPDSPIIFHRKEILGFKGPYQVLRDEIKKELFDRAILRLISSTEYTAITALIDKQWMMRQGHWERMHPYHYLMEIMVEKYTQFLVRKNDFGDIMPESRGQKDNLLQSAFDDVRQRGCAFVNADLIRSRIRAQSLKFRTKKDNISGLQLCDLLAHPSHMFVRKRMGHDVNLGAFAEKVSDILNQTKYDRSPWNGKIVGYGIKHLPQ
ncbi:MAG: hypothetical protein RLZ07_139 [Pseudomonadota bacterium]|jgi:hypothetical protein